MRSTERQGGAVAVELAIVAIPMMFMLFGITEFGRAMYQYDTIAKSVRAAARHLTRFSPLDLDYAQRLAEARCLAAFGTLDCSGPALAPGLTTAMVDVCDAADATACPGQAHSLVPTGSGVINLVTVRVTAYPFASAATFVMPDLTFGDATASDPARRGIAATMRQDL